MKNLFETLANLGRRDDRPIVVIDPKDKAEPILKVGDTQADPDRPGFQDPGLEALIARSNLR